MARKLRLLKVVVQPHFVIDDGESLEEAAAQPITVAAGRWPAWATEEFPALLDQARAQVEESNVLGGQDGTPIPCAEDDQGG